jgi:hypothetical protein
MIDTTLADSFPASDPPSWTLGRERYQEQESARSTTKEIAEKKFVMKTDIGLSNEQRDNVVQILNTLLSDEYVLIRKPGTTTGT